MELLNRLNTWYQTHCDGSWEHMFGITLETMDNPGWELIVDLTDTLLEDVEFQTIQRGDPEDVRDHGFTVLRRSHVTLAGEESAIWMKS